MTTPSTEDSWLGVAFRAYLDWRDVNEPGVDTDTAWGTYVDNHTAKLEELKAAILQHEAAAVKAARLDELQSLNHDIFGDLTTKEQIKEMISKHIGRLAELLATPGKEQS